MENVVVQRFLPNISYMVELFILDICLQEKIDAIAVIEKMSTIKMHSIFLQIPPKSLMIQIQINDHVKAVGAVTIATIWVKP